jgi:hypothetical protein
MRQGGFADPHGLGQLALVGWLADLQVEQDQPDRQRAARFVEDVVTTRGLCTIA